VLIRHSPPVPGLGLLHTFDQPIMGMAETERDVFYVSTSNLYTTHESSLQRVDLRHWKPGMPVPIERG
jgi:hypothetical protein